MKKLLFYLFPLVFLSCNYSESKPKGKQPGSIINDTIFLEKMEAKKSNVLKPKFPGGKEQLVAYVNEMKNAKGFGMNSYGEKVYIAFTIDSIGNVTNCRIMQESSCKECNDFSLSIVNSFPRWEPAYDTDSQGNKLNPISWDEVLMINF
ncbi:MAG TPA: hypothetical protein PKL06_01755 [Chitinophagales bacterium]|nr:hypothetical protein [Chitinophagales bacterium]